MFSLIFQEFIDVFAGLFKLIWWLGSTYWWMFIIVMIAYWMGWHDSKNYDQK